MSLWKDLQAAWTFFSVAIWDSFCAYCRGAELSAWLRVVYRGQPLPLKSQLYARKVPLNTHEKLLRMDQGVKNNTKLALKTFLLMSRCLLFPNKISLSHGPALTRERRPSLRTDNRCFFKTFSLFLFVFFFFFPDGCYKQRRYSEM